MKALLGYIIRIICVLSFLMLILVIINNLFYKKHEEIGSAFLTGYYFGTVLGFLLFVWLLYKFSKFGGKLIKNTKNTNKINEIGEE